jgi:hypothetical protein
MFNIIIINIINIIIFIIINIIINKFEKKFITIEKKIINLISIIKLKIIIIIIIIIITRFTTLAYDMLFTNLTSTYQYHNDLYYL